MSSYIIRKAVREDMKQVFDMIVELATYEKEPNGVKITSKDLERDGFDVEIPFFFSYVVESTDTKKLVGYSICNLAYSSWTARAMYIEDLYVKPELRGEKLGHKLFKEMCKIARDIGCHRIDWHCLVDNTLAIKFYESHGAYDLCLDEKRTCFRIGHEDILKVANGD